MRNRLLTLCVSLLSLFVLMILPGCSETIPGGTEVLPIGDRPENIFSDTSTIYSWTVREDSLRTDKLFAAPLGYMEDPVFGTTKSTLLTGFRIPNISINGSFADTVGGYYLDSIVLALMISDIYGDTTLPMGFTIYKLASPLDPEELYYSNTRFPQGMVEIGRISNYRPGLYREYDEDTVLTDLGPQLRIRLNPFFGQSLISILKTDIIISNELFHQYLPGVVIIPDESPASMLEINMITNTTSASLATALQNSRIQMYYKNSKDVSFSAIFPVSNLNLGINNFNHDYSSTNVESALASSAPEGDPVNYIQGLAGVKTKIVFPYIGAYPENTAVLKAELVITQLNDGLQDVFPPAPRLIAVRIDEDGNNENITDYSTFPAGHFGGFAEEVELEGGQQAYRYRINISDYMQRLIFDQAPNDGMYITVYPAQITEITSLNTSDLIPHRVLIGGGNNTVEEYRMRLDLTYTVLD